MTLEPGTRVKLVENDVVYFQGCDGFTKLGILIPEGSTGRIMCVVIETPNKGVSVVQYVVEFDLLATSMIVEMLCAPYQIEAEGRG